MDNQIVISDIMHIETLPKVFYQLETVGKYIDENLKDLATLECTEENKIEVKRRRAEINTTLKDFENARKAIKEQVLEPFNMFQDKYEQEVKTKLESASNELKTKIDLIENEQKTIKKQNLEEFFNRYRENYKLEDIIKFEDVGLNITLSASEKSLKEQIVAFCEKVNEDLKAIALDENSDEILLEYTHNGFNYTNAKVQIVTYHQQLEKLKAAQQEIEMQQQQDEMVVQNVNTLCSAPTPVVEDEEMTLTFTVTAPKSKLIELRNFMKEHEIDYK